MKDSFIEYIDMLLLACEIQHQQEKDDYYKTYYQASERQIQYAESLINGLTATDEETIDYRIRLLGCNKDSVSDLIDELKERYRDQEIIPHRQLKRYQELKTI